MRNDIMNISTFIASGIGLMILSNRFSVLSIQFVIGFFLGYAWLILGLYSLMYWFKGYGGEIK